MLREISNGVLFSNLFIVSFIFDAYVWVYVLLEDLLLVQYELYQNETSEIDWRVTLCCVIICTDQFNIDPKDRWWSIMWVESFHIIKIILLTCRIWLTLYIVFQSSNPELSKFILCKAYIDDYVLECRQWLACSWSPYILLETCCVTSLRGHLHHDHHKRNLALLKKFGPKRLHSWSRISSQTDTRVKGQTSTPPPQSSTCFALHIFVMASNAFYWGGLARKFSLLASSVYCLRTIFCN